MKNSGGVKVLEEISDIISKSKKDVILKNNSMDDVDVRDILNGLKKENFGEKYTFANAFKIHEVIVKDNNFKVTLRAGKDIRLSAYLKRKS